MKCFLLVLFAIIARPVSAQETAGLVGRWKMDNLCELTDEISEASANGVITDISLTTNKSNAANAALSFNLSTSYITLGAVNKLKLAGDKSMSFWIKPSLTGTTHTGSVFLYGTGIIIRYLEQTSVPRLTIIFGNTTYMQVNLAANQWQLVVITFKKDFNSTKSKASCYVNSVLAAESEQNKTAHDFDNSIAMIGPSNQNTLTNGFRGSLDDLKIYDRTLSNTEILNIALPVRLDFFRVKKVNDLVELLWLTRLEENVAHFDMQKSIDGITFKKIGQLNAGKFNYQAYDVSGMFTPMAWYRLAIVDRDGKITYSNVVRISADDASEAGVKIFPNPGSGYINIVGATARGSIRIINNSGATVKQQQFSPDNAIDISNLVPGFYYVILSDGNKKTTLKFNKQ